MYTLIIKDAFSSAHFLNGHDGKCRELHGHTWKIEIRVVHDQLDRIGMVADFSYLKRELTALINDLDHRCLNDLVVFKTTNPTSENIAQYIFDEYMKKVAPLRVSQVRVWESDSASVIYRP
ncbi:MAG: 6-carboxytetrahydropterin synthase QueD [Candidatus Omnitrophica bacterium]|nr:6-carboxytetrahydropterin synthase QueD [Candidatus Omnitrophota bacterium]